MIVGRFVGRSTAVFEIGLSIGYGTNWRTPRPPHPQVGDCTRFASRLARSSMKIIAASSATGVTVRASAFSSSAGMLSVEGVSEGFSSTVHQSFHMRLPYIYRQK